MSDSTELAPYVTAIRKAEKRFADIAKRTGVDYERECVFAMQALMKTSYAMDTANGNPLSLQLAMVNVASTGLTLNPANAYAYLIPRDRQIVLDISYKGLIKIATDAGSIVWARADIVYEQDRFLYHGPAAMPQHDADPFAQDRGAIVGCYCIAKTKDGDILTEVMPISEIEKIRDTSTAYIKAKKGPWVTWFEQMCKKAVIKRASKTWPYTDDRLQQAVQIANDAEGGYDFDNPANVSIPDTRKRECDDTAEQYATSIDVIKGEIHAWDETEDDAHLYTVMEAWGEIPRAAQMSLWLAPSKGGVFTTHERDVIKTKLPRNANAQEAA